MAKPAPKKKPETTNEVRIVLKGVRLAFAQALYKKMQVNGEGSPAYSSSFIIPGDDDVQIAAMEKAIEKAAKIKWGAKAPGILAALKKKDRTCLHDGDDKAEWEGFEGNMFVSARSNTAKPRVMPRDKDLTVEEGEDEAPYGGCIVDVSLGIWGQDNKFGTRINAQLRGVRFVDDGDAFGGGSPASADEFDDLSDGADADDVVEDEDDIA